MRYFHELKPVEQEQVLDNLQSLPLFKNFREDARTMLLASKLYIFDDKLNMLVIWEEGKGG